MIRPDLVDLVPRVERTGACFTLLEKWTFSKRLVLNLYYTFTARISVLLPPAAGSVARGREINVYSLSIISHGPSNNFPWHTGRTPGKLSAQRFLRCLPDAEAGGAECLR